MKCLKCLLTLSSSQEHYGLHKACFADWFHVSGNDQFVNLSRKLTGHSESRLTQKENTSFFHGKFKKYSADLGGEAFILKMKEPEAPELPEVEYLCNQIGKILHIPVAEFYLISLGEDRVFVTRNFMGKDPQSDLQHIYHYRQKDEHSCEGLIQAIWQYTQSVHDVNVLVQTILFDALIGNHDRHGRNLGFVRSAGRIALSPIYDNVSYLGLESGQMLMADFNPTGRISTQRTDEPSMRDYVVEFLRLGYGSEVSLFFNRIDFKKINKMIEKSFCGNLMKKAIKKLIFKRYKELEIEFNA